MTSLAVCKSPRPGSPHARVQLGPLAAAHAQVLAALASGPPRSLPIWPQAADAEQRGAQLQEILGAVSIYLGAVLEELAQNVPRDLDMRQIEALCCDLASEVAGTINAAAAALPGGRS